MARRRRKRGGLIAVAAAVVAAAAWLHPGLDLGYRGDTVAIAAPVNGVDLASLLSQVKVVDRISDVAGYERSCAKGKGCVFGPAWNDPQDRSGCETRNRVLRTTLQDVTFKDGTHDCKVTGGVLDPDPYTGQRIMFSSNTIQIDHIYPLARAFDAGASQWDQLQRQIFANDPTELVPVSAAANRAKSDSGIDEWLPVFQPCNYIQRYLTVAVKYQLPITVAERDVANSTCQIAPPAAA